MCLTGTNNAPGAPAWVSLYCEDYLGFRRRMARPLGGHQLADLVVMFQPGVLETRQTQIEYADLLRNLLSTSMCPVLMTEFDHGDLANLERFLSTNVLPFLNAGQQQPQVVARGENPFRSLSTRQVSCAVNEVTQNNGTWLLMKPTQCEH